MGCRPSWGSPLGTGRFRDLTFKALHGLGVHVGVNLPRQTPDDPMKARAFGSNFMQTMQAVDKGAGLFPPPKGYSQSV